MGAKCQWWVANLLFSKNFAENGMNMKEIGPRNCHFDKWSVACTEVSSLHDMDM